MNTFIVQPQTKAKEEAVRAFLEALQVDFEIDSRDQEICILPPHVVDAVKKSEEQIKEGQFYTYNKVKEILANRKNWK